MYTAMGYYCCTTLLHRLHFNVATPIGYGVMFRWPDIPVSSPWRFGPKTKLPLICPRAIEKFTLRRGGSLVKHHTGATQ